MKAKLFVMVMVAILFATSCKTNENNYRAAYEVAKERSKDGVDDETYARIQSEAMPQKTVINGDSMRVINVAVAVVRSDDNATKTMNKYNVVAAKFRQLFNAKAMTGRLVEKGYNPIILKDAEQWFYVVVASVETSEEASVILNKIAEDKSIVLREPYPCVLIPSNK